MIKTHIDQPTGFVRTRLHCILERNDRLALEENRKVRVGVSEERHVLAGNIDRKDGAVLLVALLNERQRRFAKLDRTPDEWNPTLE